jgi:hypothetical protein
MPPVDAPSYAMMDVALAKGSEYQIGCMAFAQAEIAIEEDR